MKMRSRFLVAESLGKSCQEPVGDDDEGSFLLNQTSSNLPYPKGNFWRCLTARLARSL